MNEDEIIQMEIDIRENKNKAQKKHYLNPSAKAFINKFKKVLKRKVKK